MNESNLKLDKSERNEKHCWNGEEWRDSHTL